MCVVLLFLYLCKTYFNLKTFFWAIPALIHCHHASVGSPFSSTWSAYTYHNNILLINSFLKTIFRSLFKLILSFIHSFIHFKDSNTLEYCQAFSRLWEGGIVPHMGMGPTKKGLRPLLLGLWGRVDLFIFFSHFCFSYSSHYYYIHLFMYLFIFVLFVVVCLKIF